MKNLKKKIAEYVTDIALIAGAAVVAIGAGMIDLPAGFIVGGCLLIAGAVLSSLDGGDEK